MTSADHRAAAPAELPRYLQSPPWEWTREPVVMAARTAERPGFLAWQPGEKERASKLPVKLLWDGEGDRDEFIAAGLAYDHARDGSYHAAYLVAGVEATVRPYLERGRAWGTADEFLRILARFGSAAVDFVLRSERGYSGVTRALLPVGGSEVTRRMAELLAGPYDLRWDSTCRRWFERHIDSAAPDLVAAALSAPQSDRSAVGIPGRGKPRGEVATSALDRGTAEVALRRLAEQGLRAALLAAAEPYGPEGVAAIAAAADPLLELPDKIPALPDWLTPNRLPPIILRDSGKRLPVEAVTVFCTMLAMSGPAHTYAGVREIAALGTPESLADFVFELFETWNKAGFPHAGRWVMHAGAVLGDARFFDRISRMIETWNSCGNHLVAHAALEAYAANGSDSSLAQLFRLSRAARSQKLAKRAQDAVTMAARWRGLTPEDLADLIVPSHGFALDGTRQLDYGPRGFVVTLDEQLKPIVFDAVRADSGRWSQGPRRRSLPKPGVKDDAVMAGAAHREFTVLRKEVKSTAAEQLTRFEAAMVRQRRWTAERFRSRIVDHPVLWQLARRLVWVACDADGKADSAFRIAEDRSLAAVDDRPFTLDDTATVGIAHPIQLGDTLPAWAELFADYQILQPFPQLERSVHRLSEAERPVEALTRFAGRTLATGRILGANKAGWLRQDIQSGAQWNLIFRPLGEGHTLVLDFEPGIRLFNELADPVQRIAQFRLAVTGSSAQWWGQGVPFGELDEITASEALLAFLALDPREP